MMMMKTGLANVGAYAHDFHVGDGRKGGNAMKANCQIMLKEDMKTALGLNCQAGIWHDAERVSLGYDLIEFGDFVGNILVKQERSLEEKEEEKG
jgi:hypothetical protein